MKIDDIIPMVLFMTNRLGSRPRAMLWFYARNASFNWARPMDLIKQGNGSKIINYLKSMGMEL